MVDLEKSSNRHGRHFQLASKLDNLRILEIYGLNWSYKAVGGIKRYKRELPFDTKFVVEKAREEQYPELMI